MNWNHIYHFEAFNAQLNFIPKHSKKYFVQYRVCDPRWELGKFASFWNCASPKLGKLLFLQSILYIWLNKWLTRNWNLPYHCIIRKRFNINNKCIKWYCKTFSGKHDLLGNFQLDAIPKHWEVPYTGPKKMRLHDKQKPVQSKL